MMGDNTTTFEVGSLAITAAGTAEQLTAGRVQQGFALTVHAHPANTGYIYIGESKADAEAHKFTLEAGASVGLRTDNVGDVWADCSVNGEIVEWITEVR
jgi:hypothetical protein